MQANINENSWDYLRRALEYHAWKTGETIAGIAGRAGFSSAYLKALAHGGGQRIGLSQIMPLCEVVPALLPHELLYLRLREEDEEGTLRPKDLAAMRRDYAQRRRLGALQRGENTSYRQWQERRRTTERRERDPA